MALKIDSVKTLTLTSASTTEEDVNYRAFKIANNSADKTIYFKEKADDDTDVTADNGFIIPANTVLDCVFRAKKLSLKASGASTTCKILYVTEEN